MSCATITFDREHIYFRDGERIIATFNPDLPHIYMQEFCKWVGERPGQPDITCAIKRLIRLVELADLGYDIDEAVGVLCEAGLLEG